LSINSTNSQQLLFTKNVPTFPLFFSTKRKKKQVQIAHELVLPLLSERGNNVIIARCFTPVFLEDTGWRNAAPANSS
jgi:hypothetical protein